MPRVVNKKRFDRKHEKEVRDPYAADATILDCTHRNSVKWIDGAYRPVEPLVFEILGEQLRE